MFSPKKTILVFTGGGLAPALNPTLAGVISAAQDQGWRVLGGLYGWSCLHRNGRVIDLTDFDTESLRTVGGTFLRSSRTNPFASDDGPALVQEKIKEYGVDCVVAIGGDDTLGAAQKLYEKYNLPIVGIPKTIDNDLQATYWTPGYPSAARAVADYSYEIKIDAAFALSRIYIIEVLGRQSGWLAAAAAHGMADVIIPPEREVKLDRVIQAVAKRYERNGNFATVVISEEVNFDREVNGMLQDANQHDSFQVQRKSFVGLDLCKKITAELGVAGKPLFPGNFVQTGAPIPEDAEIAYMLGQRAVVLLQQGSYGRMCSITRTSGSAHMGVTDVALSEAVGAVRFLDKGFFDYEAFRVTNAFLEYAEPFLGTLQQRAQDPYRQIIRQVHGTR